MNKIQMREALKRRALEAARDEVVQQVAKTAFRRAMDHFSDKRNGLVRRFRRFFGGRLV